MKRLSDFLFWVAGVMPELQNILTKQDKLKFQSVGISLILSSVLSVISFSYAVFLVSQSILSALLIGLMWGVLVLSLNRILNVQIWSNPKRDRFIRFFPYLFLSILLAASVTFPIELKLFESRIDKEIFEKSLAEIERIETHYNTRIEEAHHDIEEYRKELREELIGLGATQKAGAGSLVEKLENIIDSKQVELYQLHAEKTTTVNQLRLSKPSFLTRVEALHKVTNNSSSIRIVYYLVMVLMMLIEVFPLLLSFALGGGGFERIQNQFRDVQTNNELKLENTVHSENSQNEVDQFKSFCKSAINNLDKRVDVLEKRAREQLRNGLLISLLGILAFLGYGAFLFIVYFENHEFQNQHVFLFSSLSIVFFFLQFLAGWYLKQHRITLSFVSNVNRDKERYRKYLLSRIVTSEIGESQKKKSNEARMLISVLSETKKMDLDSLQESDGSERTHKELIDLLIEMKKTLEKGFSDGK